MKQKIRTVVDSQARLPVAVDTLADGDDLYAAGMTSHGSINLMLGLEDAFDVEFPDHLLTRAVFASVDSISSALSELSAAE